METLQTTLITNIFNEEYLLPFWLNYHKNLFDNIIIVDYNSTDRSIEICKTICPNCIIIKTRNSCFEAFDIDNEFIDIENNIKGIKIILNVTEFLICKKPIKELFKENENKSYLIKQLSPYSRKIYNIDNIKDLFKNLLNEDIRYSYDRGIRIIHNYNNGNYTVGRHNTNNKSVETNDLFIIWFGYYPLNERLLKRKLQISEKIPKKNYMIGISYHHLFSLEHMLLINNIKSDIGERLIDLNPDLYTLIEKINKELVD